jgi:hypothetical protein
MAPQSTAPPNHVKIDIPLVRSRDNRDLGTLSLIRDNMWKLYDDQDQRLVNPVLVDTLIITLTNAKGEQVCWHQMPMQTLLGDDGGIDGGAQKQSEAETRQV